MIRADLKNTCGDSLIGDEIKSLSFKMVKYEKQEYALLLINLSIDNTDDLLAISILRGKNDVIRYNYNFINSDVQV